MRIMICQNQGSFMCFYNRVAKCQSKSQTSVTIRNCCFPCIKHLKNMCVFISSGIPGPLSSTLICAFPSVFVPRIKITEPGGVLFYCIVKLKFTRTCIIRRTSIRDKNKFFAVCHNFIIIMFPADMPQGFCKSPHPEAGLVNLNFSLPSFSLVMESRFSTTPISHSESS